MTISIVNDGQQWDAFVDESPYGLLFHKWDFLKIVEKYSGYRLLPYGIFENDELVCAFPLFFKNYNGFKIIQSPPPKMKVSYLGFVMGKGYDSLEQYGKERRLNDVVEQVNGAIDRLHPNYVSILTVPNFDDIRPFIWNGYRARIGYEYAVDLTQAVDKIWESLSMDCRKRIKSCGKSQISISQVSDTDKFFSLMGGSMRPRGRVSIHGHIQEYIRELMATYPDHIKMYFLYDNGDIAGITIKYMYKDKYVGWILSSKENYSDYLEWEFIKRAKAEGYKKYENPDADTRRLTTFKSKFNPSLEADYLLYKKDAVGAIAIGAYSKAFNKNM